MGVISNIVAKLTLDNSQYKRGLNESQSQTSKFGNAIGKVGGLIAGAFAAKQVIDFAGEMASLSVKVSGVTKAFEQLDDIDLADLRAATGGMVSDLELMQRAVQAKNLGLPIQQLATFFEFATLRAAETGESVDYLVNSIVTGIGRKSVMIMDNLGISSVALREEIERVGDFGAAAGNIIQREMAKSALSVQDITDGTKTLAAEWQNFSTELSTSGVGTFFNDLLKDLTAMLRLIRENNKASSESPIYGDNGVVTGDFLKSGREELTGELEKLEKDRDLFFNNWHTKTSEDEKAFWSIQYDTALENIEKIKAAIETLDTDKGGVGDMVVKRTESKLTSLTTRTSRLGDFGKMSERLRGAARALGQEAENAAGSFEILGRTFVELPEVPAPSDEDIQAWQDMNKAILDLEATLQSMAAGALVAFGEAIGTVFAGGGIENAMQQFIGSIAGLMKQFGSLLIAWGTSQIALKASLSNPYAAIAAGVALVAIGSALATTQRQVTGSVGSSAAVGVGGGSFTGRGYYSGPGGGTGGSNEIVLKAKGSDLVAVIDEQTIINNING